MHHRRGGPFPPPTLALTLGLALALTLALPAAAVDLHLEQHNRRECSGQFDTALALENATLYAQVYEWIHHHEVTDWTYATLLPLNGTDTRCAVVSYKTFVQSPTFFARLLSNFHMLLQFPIEVHKTVCVIGEAVVEDATITVPLLHELTMAARYEPQDGQINSTIDAQYTLPWYIDFLVSDVSDHLRSNFKEKVDAVAHTLCSHTPSVASLSSPDHAYLRGGHGKTGKGDPGGQGFGHRLPPPRHGHGNGRDHRIPHKPHTPPP
jgi:hypothetical protein